MRGNARRSLYKSRNRNTIFRIDELNPVPIKDPDAAGIGTVQQNAP
jgi:hypothetical protein